MNGKAFRKCISFQLNSNPNENWSIEEQQATKKNNFVFTWVTMQFSEQ